MNEAKAEPAVLRMTVQVIRANTGKVETFELTGTPVAEQAEPVTTPEAAKDK